MLRGQEERKYSIRKYSIGVVSVLWLQCLLCHHMKHKPRKTTNVQCSGTKRNTKSTGRTRERDNVTSNAVRKAIRRYA